MNWASTNSRIEVLIKLISVHYVNSTFQYNPANVSKIFLMSKAKRNIRKQTKETKVA